MTGPQYDADRAAVEAYRNRQEWKQIHLEWAERSKRELSPHSFGKLVIDLHAQLYPTTTEQEPLPQKPQEQHHQHHHQHHQHQHHHSRSQPQPQHQHQQQQQQQHQQQNHHHQNQQQQQHQQQQQQDKPHSATIHQTPTPISATHRSPTTTFKPVNPESRSAHHAAPPSHQNAAPPPPSSSARPLPPVIASTAANSPPNRLSSAAPVDHLHKQPVTRAEFQDMQNKVMRLNDSVMRIQDQLQRMASDLTSLFEHKAAPHARSGDEALDQLADSLSHMATKVGDIDGMKIQLDLLKSRVKRIEGEPPQLNIQAPSPRDPYGPPSMARMPPPAPPGSLQTPISATTATPSTANTETSTGWNAANSNKRKLSPVEPARGADKRPRSDSPASAVNPGDRNYTTYTSSGVPTLTPMPRPPERSLQISPTSGYYSSASEPAPQQWISESGRQYNLAGRRGPGRPRKGSPDLPTPTHWEKESWISSTGAEYRPITSADPSAVDPYSDRGRIIRRGSGGLVSQSFYSHTNAENLKKTRQRPIRNSDGVLIRKDGKPDQRSVSSPMNLKKVHARKMEIAAAGGAPGADPADDNPDDDGEHDSALSNSSSNSPGQRSSATPSQAPADVHRTVMAQMFPNGIDSEALKRERMFAPAKPAPDSRVADTKFAADARPPDSRGGDEATHSGAPEKPSRPSTASSVKSPAHTPADRVRSPPTAEPHPFPRKGEYSHTSPAHLPPAVQAHRVPTPPSAPAAKVSVAEDGNVYRKSVEASTAAA